MVSAPVAHRLRTARGSLRRAGFRWLERRGWHLLRVNEVDPVPDTRTLRDAGRWLSTLSGVDMRPDAQLALLDRFRGLRDEFAELGLDPGMGSVDMEVLHGLLRLYEPARFVEVNSGVSTRVATRLLRPDGDGDGARVTVIDPGDGPLPLEGVEVRRHPVREVPVSWFGRLRPGDVLFVDTSHVLRAGSDVQYLLLEVLPNLPVGVLVHIHDIFLPREYPAYWFDGLRFANEQHAVQAFLAFNDSFEVLWSTSYLHHHHADRLAEVFVSYDPGAEWQGGSLWIRRVR